MSSGCAGRRIWRYLMYTWRKGSVSYSEEPSGSFDMRVSTNPGATALTRTPRAAKSTARHRVMLIRAAFAELYATARADFDLWCRCAPRPCDQFPDNGLVSRQLLQAVAAQQVGRREVGSILR